MKKTREKASAELEEEEQAFEQIRLENAELIKEFASWMHNQGASQRTLCTHLPNAAFYIHKFLLYEQSLRAHEGVGSIGRYLGYWFIRKDPIATPGTVKTTATSLVKFYSFLVEKGLVTAEQLGGMRKMIRAQMGHWQERARRYNNPAITDPGKI